MSSIDTYFMSTNAECAEVQLQSFQSSFSTEPMLPGTHVIWSLTVFFWIHGLNALKCNRKASDPLKVYFLTYDVFNMNLS